MILVVLRHEIEDKFYWLNLSHCHQHKKLLNRLHSSDFLLYLQTISTLTSKFNHLQKEIKKYKLTYTSTGSYLSVR